eukprot:2144951-Alexandrium_andersonii.AAC.1
MDSVLWCVMEHIANTDDGAGGYAGLLERAGYFDEQPVTGPTPFRCCNPVVAHKAAQAFEPPAAAGQRGQQ